MRSHALSRARALAGEHLRRPPLGGRLPGIDPDRTRRRTQSAQPRALVLREPARLDLDPLDRLLEAALTAQVGEQLLVSQGLAGLRAQARTEAPDLVEQPAVEHPAHALVDAPVELR